jgi:hypothetical protein
MGYRMLTIDDKHYEYVIGRNFTKIRGGEAIPNSKAGWPVGVWPPNDRLPVTRYMVTPGTLCEYLTKGQVDVGARQCCNHANCKNMASSLRPLPFAVEIHHKQYFKFICDDCYQQNADDI